MGAGIRPSFEALQGTEARRARAKVIDLTWVNDSLQGSEEELHGLAACSSAIQCMPAGHVQRPCVGDCQDWDENISGGASVEAGLF